MINTPLGSVIIVLDDEPIECTVEPIAVNQDRVFEVNTPKKNTLFYMTYDYLADGKKHDLKIYLDKTPCAGDIETDEHQESLVFENPPWNVGIAVMADFGLEKDYGLDFEGFYEADGITLSILPTTKSQTFKFAVAYAHEDEDTDAYNWVALMADPSWLEYYRNQNNTLDSTTQE